jgi:hypothetical protein
MSDLEKKVQKSENKDYKLSEAERKSASSAISYELMIASHNYQETSQEVIAPPMPPDPLPPPPNYAPTPEASDLESIAESPETMSAPSAYVTEKQTSDEEKKKKVLLLSAAATIIFLAILGLLFTTPGALTGFTTANREVQQTINFNQSFNQYTETQLDLGTITGLKISGNLEGTGAKIILRINGTDYLVADITNPNIVNLTTETEPAPPEQIPQYSITTDKSSYLLGETVTITVTPDTENKSLYVSYGEQTQILENNTYLTQNLGEHQAIALITLPNDILRIETNFTVTNESTNETTSTENLTPPSEPPLPEQTSTYEFSGLCAETCNIPETSNAILIIETSENSTLTITQITTTQNKENQAPEQTQTIPDITQTTQETTTLDLNKYFSDPDNDTIQYDINQIPEIDATISQNILTIASATPGIYTAYIYATDGDKLVTSNTFTITIISATTETPTETNQTTNTTTNETIPITNTTETPTATDPCSNPDLNLRPSTCFVGLEEQAFESLSLPLQDRQRGNVGMFTRFGNLIIKGMLVQGASGTPNDNDFQIGFTENSEFNQTNIMTVWIDSETGNLYLKGKIYENQEILEPAQYNTYVIRNKFGLILGYFDQLKGDLYLRGNIVQLGKV